MLRGRYADYAGYLGQSVAKGLVRAEIERAEKKDKIRRFEERILELSSEDVGAAYKNILAAECGNFIPERKTDAILKAENLILAVRILELEC